MEKVKIEFDEKAINDKIFKIGEIIDGLRIPEIFCILGSVIMGLVQNGRSQGYDINGFFVEWLKNMARGIEKMPELENEEKLLN